MTKSELAAYYNTDWRRGMAVIEGKRPLHQSWQQSKLGNSNKNEKRGQEWTQEITRGDGLYLVGQAPHWRSLNMTLRF